MIAFDSLTKRFGRNQVLKGVTLNIERGHRVALVGSNGAGKTTLIRCLLGEYVCEGSVRVDGQDPREHRRDVLSKVGFVQSVGFIDEVDYRECVGNLRVRANSNGFCSFEGGRQNKSYTQNVKGGIGQRNGQGPWIFTFEATGSIGVEDEGSRSARVMLYLELAPGDRQLDMVSFPRGLYRIGPNHSSNNKLIIWYNDGSGEVPAIEVFQADVLVARASGNLIEGSVFVKTFINHTELFKLPQAPKQERVMTFRKAK